MAKALHRARPDEAPARQARSCRGADHVRRDRAAARADRDARDDVAHLVDGLSASARDAIRDVIERMPKDLNEVMGEINDHGDQATSHVGKAIAATGSLVFHTVLMLIALFFLLVRGHELVAWLDSVSPLRRGQTQELLATFRKVSFAVIASAGITAAVQAAARSCAAHARSESTTIWITAGAIAKLSSD
jgi:hypothetical protein